MPRAALLRWLTLTCLLLTAAGVHAQATTRSRGAERTAVDDKEARDLFKLGKQAFDEGRFERALKYFNDSYDLSHRAALLSNIATALDRLRRDQEALDTYMKYLEQVPEAPNRAQVEERVRIIQAAMDKTKADAQAQAAPQPSAAPTPAETARAASETNTAPLPATEATSAQQSESSSAITSRWWFWAGLGTLAAGAIAVGIAASASGGGTATESPAVIGAATRIRTL